MPFKTHIGGHEEHTDAMTDGYVSPCSVLLLLADVVGFWWM